MKSWIYGFFDRDIRMTRLLGVGLLLLTVVILLVTPEDATPVLVIAPLGAYMVLDNPYAKRRKGKRK